MLDRNRRMSGQFQWAAALKYREAQEGREGWAGRVGGRALAAGGNKYGVEKMCETYGVNVKDNQSAYVERGLGARRPSQRLYLLMRA